VIDVVWDELPDALGRSELAWWYVILVPGLAGLLVAACPEDGLPRDTKERLAGELIEVVPKQLLELPFVEFRPAAQVSKRYERIAFPLSRTAPSAERS
jgi:hypothetical protein